MSPQGFKCEKTALEKALAADFDANEKRYRYGCAGHRFSLHGEKGFSRG